jgi:hypothetical protein
MVTRTEQPMTPIKFITTPHPVDDLIIAVREYVDTHHASQTLVPAVLAAAAQGQGSSTMRDLLGGVGTSSDDVHG